MIANQSSLQRKITMQERHLCWPPYFFSLAPQCPPQFFHSRIATGKTIFISSTCLFAILKINSTEHQLSCLSITAQINNLWRNSWIKNYSRSATYRSVKRRKQDTEEWVATLFHLIWANVFKNRACYAGFGQIKVFFFITRINGVIPDRKILCLISGDYCIKWSS